MIFHHHILEPRHHTYNVIEISHDTRWLPFPFGPFYGIDTLEDFLESRRNLLLAKS